MTGTGGGAGHSGGAGGQAGAGGGAAGQAGTAGGAGGKGGLAGSSTGSGGKAGAAGAGGKGGSGGPSAGGAGGKAGNGGVTGSAGAGGGIVTTGGATGSVATGGATGSLATGGATGGAATGGATGVAATGGSGGSVSMGGAGGMIGTAGSAGTAPGGQGMAGAGGADNTPLRLVLSKAYPEAPAALGGLLVAVDTQDTAVVVGASASSAVADPGPMISWYPRNATSRSMVFSGATTPSAMTTDVTNAIWMVGPLSQPVTFGGPTLQPIDAGYYLVKLASDGTHLFSVAVQSLDVTVPEAIVTDAQGNAYVVGGAFSTDGLLENDVFVTKFSSVGTTQFDKRYPGGDSQAAATGVAISPNGDVVVGGFFDGSITFGAAQLDGVAGALVKGFVAVLNPIDGTPRNAFAFGGSTFDMAAAVQTTGTGTLRLSGQLSGSSTVGGMTVEADPTQSGFVADISSTGVANWVRLLDPASVVLAADTNQGGRSFVVGRGVGSTMNSFVSALGNDAVVTTPLRAATQPGNGASACAADRHGGVWVGGEFQGTVDFGMGNVTGTDPAQPAAFLLHLEP